MPTCSHVVHTAAHSTPSGEDRQIYISLHSRGGLFFPGSARTAASTSSFLPHSRTRMDRASRSADRSFRPVRMFLLRVSSNCPDHGSSRGRRTAAADSVQRRSNINGKSHLPWWQIPFLPESQSPSPARNAPYLLCLADASRLSCGCRNMDSSFSDKKGGISHLHNKESHRRHGHAAGYKITAYFFLLLSVFLRFFPLFRTLFPMLLLYFFPCKITIKIRYICPDFRQYFFMKPPKKVRKEDARWVEMQSF